MIANQNRRFLCKQIIRLPCSQSLDRDSHVIKISYFNWLHEPELLFEFWKLRKLAIFGIISTNLNKFNLRSFKILVHVFWKAEKYKINKFGIMCVLYYSVD